MSEDGSCDETTAKIGHHLTTKKGRQFFRRKIEVTPSFAVPGDTNPSDAIGQEQHTCAGKSISGVSSSAGAIVSTIEVHTVSKLVAVSHVHCAFVDICNVTKFNNKLTPCLNFS